MSPRVPPLSFLLFCNRMHVWKSKRVPSSTFFGTVRHFPEKIFRKFPIFFQKMFCAFWALDIAPTLDVAVFFFGSVELIRVSSIVVEITYGIFGTLQLVLKKYSFGNVYVLHFHKWFRLEKNRFASLKFLFRHYETYSRQIRSNKCFLCVSIWGKVVFWVVCVSLVFFFILRVTFFVTVHTRFWLAIFAYTAYRRLRFSSNVSLKKLWCFINPYCFSELETGSCTITTKNLDGETNLKNKLALSHTHNVVMSSVGSRTNESNGASVEGLTETKINNSFYDSVVTSEAANAGKKKTSRWSRFTSISHLFW